MANPGADSRELDQLCINTIRTLSMDAVQAANSGHPGTPMALAPLAYVIWTRHLKHNPADPQWVDRDRFILSAGHASMLLYSLLYLSGYGLTLDDLKNFRQWESKTPGHPEYGMTDGVETTTGPLGQGFANGVGMAMAEAHVAAVHNRPEHNVIDHYVYAICSDGDLMEGVAAEAASVAGHLKLGKLIYFWDDNRITIEGDTELAFTENVEQRFEAYGWHTQRVEDGNDLEAIDAAIRAAQADPRPSMISVRTIIGFGSPNTAGSEKAHGEPLGAEEIVKTKQNLGWPSTESFHVPQEALDHMREIGQRGAERQREWQARFDAYRAAHPDAAAALEQALSRTLPEGWDADLPVWTKDDKPIATRAASGKALNAIAKKVNWLIGGSADLAGSNNTMIEGAGSFLPPDYTGRNLHFGVREHAMGSLMNGMTLHGGVRVYGGTFLIFSEYMRPPVRLAALMEQPAIYIYTHDSVGLGEDGPTHQPIEHLAALRAIPGLDVVRPADANETGACWSAILKNGDRPAGLILSRQALPIVPRGEDGFADTSNVAKGAYVLKDSEGTPDVILIGTGSELQFAVAAAEQLAGEGVAARVVSMPCREWFDEQDETYRESVIPADIKARVSIEAGVSIGWRDLVGDAGRIISINHYGASASGSKLMTEFGFTADAVVSAAKESVEAAKSTSAPTHLAASGPQAPADVSAETGNTSS